MDSGTGDDDARPMAGAELRCTLQTLGLARDQVARLLDVAPRTVDRWMYGERDAPPGVVATVRRWTVRADSELAAMLAAYDADPGSPVITYRDDDSYADDHPDDDMPAAWHRAIVARLLVERPDAHVIYAPESTLDV